MRKMEELGNSSLSFTEWDNTIILLIFFFCHQTPSLSLKHVLYFSVKSQFTLGDKVNRARKTNAELPLNAGSKGTHNPVQMWYMGFSNFGNVQGIQKQENIFCLSPKECISKHHLVGSALSGRQK